MTTKTKTGTLKFKFNKPLSGMHYDFYECIDCETLYPELPTDINGLIEDKIRCNGHAITLCPWCRPDSKPHHAGRGI